MLDDYPDPPVDESVTIACMNPKCNNYYPPEHHESGEPGETWHPEVEYEYQGDADAHMGAVVAFFVEDSHACDFCGQEGHELPISRA